MWSPSLHNLFVSTRLLDTEITYCTFKKLCSPSGKNDSSDSYFNKRDVLKVSRVLRLNKHRCDSSHFHLGVSYWVCIITFPTVEVARALCSAQQILMQKMVAKEGERKSLAPQLPNAYPITRPISGQICVFCLGLYWLHGWDLLSSANMHRSHENLLLVCIRIQSKTFIYCVAWT